MQKDEADQSAIKATKEDAEQMQSKQAKHNKPKRRKSTKRSTKKSPERPKNLRSFPNRTLEDALIVPQKIKENNSGNPWNTEEVAAACALSKKGMQFFYLAAASRDYGLTLGSRDTERIELTDLGKKIVLAGDPVSLQNAKIEAFFKVDLFKRVYQHYGGSASLPKEEQFFHNTLQNEFNVDAEFHIDFAKVFRDNCKFLRIEDGLGEGVASELQEPINPATEIRVVGQPKGKFDRTAFVIMPFNERNSPGRSKGFFEEVLRSLITPAANQAGFAVETAERSGSDIIQSTIINQLLRADLVVADLTDHNPNVLFELGIRIAKELPVALIKADGTGPIFDVDSMMRVEPYSPNVWPSTVDKDLPKLADHFKATWDNKSASQGYMKILTRA